MFYSLLIPQHQQHAWNTEGVQYKFEEWMLWGYYKVCSLTKWVVILKLWDILVVVERIKILSLHLCDWLILGRLVSLSAVKWWYRVQVYRIVAKINNDDDEDNTNYYLWNTLLAPYIVLLNFIGLLMN